MRILITGGAGFIGTNCILFFQKRGNEIINIDKLGTGAVKKNLKVSETKFYRIDISKKFPSQILENVDLIVNFASESHVDRSITNPYFFYKNNVGLMINLLEALRKYHNEIRMVHVSTDEVYGDIIEGSFTEDSALIPSNPYSASKAAQDSFALAYSRTYGLNISITRCTNNYGPFQLPEKLIPKTIIRAIKNMKIPVYGNGMQIRDWIYVDDHCRAIETVAKKGIKGKIYNVSAGNEITNIEVVKKILKILDKSENLIKYVKDRPGHDVRYSLNSTKLRELGWKPQISFDEGIERTVNWYLNNKDWWQSLIKYI
ncbi:MAG: dTDP-glucose 4,6-dehydratase [Candidatus Micrarchaeia archaeon]